MDPLRPAGLSTAAADATDSTSGTQAAPASMNLDPAAARHTDATAEAPEPAGAAPTSAGAAPNRVPDRVTRRPLLGGARRTDRSGDDRDNDADGGRGSDGRSSHDRS
jgi:hypothetical protein